MLDDATFLEHLSRLVRERRAMFAAIARKEGLSAEDAVDCVQDALSTFLQMRSQAPSKIEEWSAYLSTMVRNAARNRRRRHYLARPHDSSTEVPLESNVDLADDLIARAEEHVRLRACVEELCEIQRAVVTLRMLDEQPGEDVARALGITPAHIAVLLHRAKHALRACLTDPAPRQ